MDSTQNHSKTKLLLRSRLESLPDFPKRKQVIRTMGWSERQYYRICKEHDLLEPIFGYVEQRIPKHKLIALL